MMTELEALYRRIFSNDDAVREAVTADEIRRYMDLDDAKRAKDRERAEILAELRGARANQPGSEQHGRLRGRDLIAQALRGK